GGEARPACVRWGGADRGVDMPALPVVRRPAVRGVDSTQREGGPPPLDHVATVLHEHLPRLPAPANHLALTRVAVVVPGHRHLAERARRSRNARTYAGM